MFTGSPLLRVIYKNGSLYKNISRSTAIATNARQGGSVSVKLNAGDYIDVRAVGNNTTLISEGNGRTVASCNWIIIKQI
jgi:hypothetical protein